MAIAAGSDFAPTLRPPRQRPALRGARLAFLSLAAALAAPAAAEEWTILGPRALGMGGAGVANLRGGYSMHWNPASLGMRPLVPPGAAKLEEAEEEPGPGAAERTEAEEEAELEAGAAPFADNAFHVGATAASIGDTLEHVTNIQDIVDSIDFDNLEQIFTQNGTLSAQDVQSISRLLVEIPALQQRGEGLYLNAAAGDGMRFGQFGLSIGAIAHGGAQPLVDLSNLALDTQGIDDILAGLPSGPINQSSQNLLNNLVAQGLIDANTGQILLFQAEQAGVDTGDPLFQQAVVALLQATQQADGSPTDLNSFLDNQTGATLRGALYSEVAVGWGQPLFSEIVSVGVALRFVYGLTYFNPLSLSQFGSETSFFEDLVDDEFREESFNIAVDTGLLFRPRDWLVIGVTGKNLNQPDFAVAGAEDFHLDPQARAGFAVMPFSWLTLAADIDLFTNHSDVLPGYDTQFVGGGAEFDLFDILFLRGGLSQNLKDHEAAPLLHAGVGLRLGWFSLEAAGVVPADRESLENLDNLSQNVEEIRLDDLPQRAGLSVMLGFNVPF